MVVERQRVQQTGMNLGTNGQEGGEGSENRPYFAYTQPWETYGGVPGALDALAGSRGMQPTIGADNGAGASAAMGPLPNSPLDPVQALERDLMDYEQQMSMQYPPVPFSPQMGTREQMVGNAQIRAQQLQQMQVQARQVHVEQSQQTRAQVQVQQVQQAQEAQQAQALQPAGMGQRQLSLPSVGTQPALGSLGQLGQVPMTPVGQLQPVGVSPLSQAQLAAQMQSGPMDALAMNASLLSRLNSPLSASLSTLGTPLMNVPMHAGAAQQPHGGTPQPALAPIPVAPMPLQIAKRFERHRPQYKPRSSIPPDLSSKHYASQCIVAAESSLLSPFQLSAGEYSYLRTRLPNVHVTTYLHIRNGILRLWLSNPLVAVTIVEAAGCCKDARYYRLAEFAFEYLTRNGYINQGCCVHYARMPNSLAPLPEADGERKQRQTIVVIGAGIAGLACARQLENLLERYADVILREYEDIPRVIVVEGRKRIGGRVYSPRLTTENATVDLGGDTITGFGGGNILGVVLRRQLGVPVVSIDTTGENNKMYDGETGDPLDPEVDYKAHELFLHLLGRMREYEMGFGANGLNSGSAAGSRSLISAGVDPLPDKKLERITIAQEEESRARESPTDPEPTPATDTSSFLRTLGYSVHEGATTPDEPAHDASLGKTLRKFIEYIETLADFSDKDRMALEWYLAKFEYQIGDKLESASLSSWSHHRDVRFTGRHAWTREGMASLARGLDCVPNKLDVRLKTVVNVIEYDEESAQVTLENGEIMQADCVVVTTPLGCLKQRNIQFIPDLPQWKQDSIDRLAVGCVNKVVLLFDTPFWSSDTPSLVRVANRADELRGDCFVFQNHSKRQAGLEKGLVIGLISGEAAARMPRLSDADIVADAVAKLRRVFKDDPRAQSAKLVESVVTRWQLDRFARGSYSHVGVEGTSTDHDLLGRPVLRSLMFAGEATSRKFPGTVHGAYLSGLRASKEVINSLIGKIEVPDKLILDEDALAEFLGEIPGTTVDMRALQLQQMQMQLANVSRVSPSAQPSPPEALKRPPSREVVLDAKQIQELEEELKAIKSRRISLANEKLQRDMLHEIGERPAKPDRNGTANPFLLFQKDYWEICRQEADEQKEREKGGKNAHASRNEIRASLGKKWRSLSEAERAPYIARTHQFKQENEERHAAYLRKLKWYESEAANFQQRWLQDNPLVPGARERQIEELLASSTQKRRRVARD